MSPIAKDKSAQFNVATLTIGNVTVNNFTINNADAKAIQKNIKTEILSLDGHNENSYEKVLLHLFQAKNDIKAKTGNSGIIESVTDKPLRLLFESDDLKKEIINMEGNPFAFVFVVDVFVGTVNNLPFTYKILKIHEVIPK